MVILQNAAAVAGPASYTMPHFGDEMKIARAKRFEFERLYFDAQVYSRERIPDGIVDRYVRGRWPWFHPDYPYSLLRNTANGKDILEIGCAEGTNAILLAMLGAKTVVGVDISPVAVAAAEERARKHGLTNCEFVTAPFETYLNEDAGKQFDVICGWAILHHLLPELEQILQGLQARLRPGGMLLLAAEPMNLQPWLRRLRTRLKLVPMEGTEDERPLEKRDLDVVYRIFPNTQVEMFRGFGRAERLWNNLWFQLLLGAVDYPLLRMPGLRSLGSIGVIICHRAG